MTPATRQRARRARLSQFGQLYVAALLFTLVPYTLAWAVPRYYERLAAEESERVAAQRLTEAHDALVHGRLDEAIVNADDVPLSNAGADRAQAIKANALIERFWETKAENDVAAAREIAAGLTDSTEAAAYAARGNLALVDNDVPRAIELLTSAIKVSPDDAYAHHQLGFALNQADRSSEALTHLTRAVSLAPEMAWVQNNLAFTLSRMERCDERIQGFKAPAVAECFEVIGLGRYERGRFQDARQAFERAVTLAPDNGMYHANLSAALLQVGDRQRAHEHARRARTLGIQDHPALTALGVR